jgi:hypothetical protein
MEFLKRRVDFGTLAVIIQRSTECGFTHRACYIAVPLYICGFVVLGAAFQKHLSVGALIMGWGIAELAVMINTVAIYTYCNDCFPKQQVSVECVSTFFTSVTVSTGRN